MTITSFTSVQLNFLCNDSKTGFGSATGSGVIDLFERDLVGLHLPLTHVQMIYPNVDWLIWWKREDFWDVTITQWLLNDGPKTTKIGWCCLALALSVYQVADLWWNETDCIIWFLCDRDTFTSVYTIAVVSLSRLNCSLSRLNFNGIGNSIIVNSMWNHIWCFKWAVDVHSGSFYNNGWLTVDARLNHNWT